MSNTYSLRRVLTVLAALLLPAATCGVAPALQDLMQRMQRVERFVENAQLPPVLIDDHGIVIGRVLDYSDVMLYSSVLNYDAYGQVFGKALSREQMQKDAFATVLFEIPGQRPIVIEATDRYLVTPVRGGTGSGFYNHESSEYYLHESSDCTGTMWTVPMDDWPAWGSAFGHARIAPPGRTLYAADYDAPSVMTPRSISRWVNDAYGGQTFRCIPFDAANPYPDDFPDYDYAARLLARTHSPPFDELAVPLRRIYDLDAFTPPFQIVDQRELWLR